MTTQNFEAVAAGTEAARRERGFLASATRTNGGIVIVFSLLLLGCIIAGLIFPSNFRFLHPDNIATVLRSMPLLGIMALGVGILMVSGEFDLSVGSLFLLSSFVMALAFADGWAIGWAILAALAIALVTGIVNGLVTTKLRIPSFIATLGMMLVLRGITLFASGGDTSMSFEPGEPVTSILTASLGIIQVQFLWLVAFAVVAYLVLHRHRLGNHFYAVGGNRDAALAVGINVDRVKMIAFVLASLMAAIAGIISTTRVNSVTVLGQPFELRAIAACVIGGVFLFGGRGSILGIFLGASLIYLVEDILFLSRAPGFYLDVIVGAIIVVAVILNTRFARPG